MQEHGRVLVVDFEPSTLRSTAEFLERSGFAVTTAGSVDRLAETLASDDHRVIVMEPALEGDDGFALCRSIRGLRPGELPIILLASYSLRGGEARRQAQEVGARFLERPFDDTALLEALHEAVAIAGCSPQQDEAELPPTHAAPAAVACALEEPQFESWLDAMFPDPTSATQLGQASAAESCPSEGSDVVAAAPVLVTPVAAPDAATIAALDTARDHAPEHAQVAAIVNAQIDTPHSHEAIPVARPRGGTVRWLVAVVAIVGALVLAAFFSGAGTGSTFRPTAPAKPSAPAPAQPQVQTLQPGEPVSHITPIAPGHPVCEIE